MYDDLSLGSFEAKQNGYANATFGGYQGGYQTTAFLDPITNTSSTPIQGGNSFMDWLGTASTAALSLWAQNEQFDNEYKLKQLEVQADINRQNSENDPRNRYLSGDGMGLPFNPMYLLYGGLALGAYLIFKK